MWILFTAQTFMSYVDARDYLDFLEARRRNDPCANQYTVEADMDWHRLLVDYSVHCTKKLI